MTNNRYLAIYKKKLHFGVFRCLVLYLLCAGLLTGCRTSGQWDNRDALTADGVDIEVDSRGQPILVEYQTLGKNAPKRVPRSVFSEMNRVFKQPKITGAAEEWRNDVRFYELTALTEEGEVQAVFDPSGNLVDTEWTLSEEGVPAHIRDAVLKRAGRGAKLGAAYKLSRDRGGAATGFAIEVLRSNRRYRLFLNSEGDVDRVLRVMQLDVALPTRDL